MISEPQSKRRQSSNRALLRRTITPRVDYNSARFFLTDKSKLVFIKQCKKRSESRRKAECTNVTEI